MTCKDCIYEKMCESRYEREHCLSFKDKANFVEVVRCKDCKHLTKEMIGGDLECVCTCSGGMIDITPDYYCSHGERRSENEG